MKWQEIVGFIAFGLNVVGNMLLTNRNARGWWIRISSNFAQLVYALLIVSPSLTLNAVTFAIINVVGIVKWRRVEGHTDRCGVAKRKPCNCGRLA